jgi:hypothetical protein
MLFMVVFFAFLHVAITEYTLPSSMMMNSENEESLASLLLYDSDTMLRNLINQGESELDETLEEIFGDMDDNDNLSSAATQAYKRKEALLKESNEESSSCKSPAHKKFKKKHCSSTDDSAFDGSIDDSMSDKSSLYQETDNTTTYNDSSYSEETDNQETDDEDKLDMTDNAFDDEDVSEKELDLPVNRNGKEVGQAVEQNHCRRRLQRNMAAVGLYANRDVTNLTNIVATSPRLTAILEKKLPKWKPSLPLLVRSPDFCRRLGPCRLFS